MMIKKPSPEKSPESDLLSWAKKAKKHNSSCHYEDCILAGEIDTAKELLTLILKMCDEYYDEPLNRRLHKEIRKCLEILNGGKT